MEAHQIQTKDSDQIQTKDPHQIQTKDSHQIQILNVSIRPEGEMGRRRAYIFGFERSGHSSVGY